MSSRLTRRKTYFCAHGSRPGAGQKECDAKFEAIKRLPDVECPACGAYDNDWPDRQGLCFDCFCAAYCWETFLFRGLLQGTEKRERGTHGGDPAAPATLRL